MFDHLTVAGYAYTAVQWTLVEPLKVERQAQGYSLPDQLWQGGIVEATVPPAGAVTDTWTYQVKVETSAEALHEARSQLGKREARQALGIARIRRFRGEAADPEAGEHRIALEGLDDGHLVDRLTSAILTWHADLNGVGPRAATPPIRARRLRG